MPTQITLDDDTEILVELSQGKGRGVIDVARGQDKDFTEKSEKAFNHAMATIRSVAKRTAATIRSLKIVEQPDVVEMKFALKLTTEANAFVASASAETQIEVKLVWNNDDKKHESTDTE